MIDLLMGIGEFLVSWRFYVGLALTGLLCWLIVSVVPNDAAELAICVPVGLVGAFLSFWWQLRADKI